MSALDVEMAWLAAADAAGITPTTDELSGIARLARDVELVTWRDNVIATLHDLMADEPSCVETVAVDDESADLSLRAAALGWQHLFRARQAFVAWADFERAKGGI